MKNHEDNYNDFEWETEEEYKRIAEQNEIAQNKILEKEKSLVWNKREVIDIEFVEDSSFVKSNIPQKNNLDKSAILNAIDPKTRKEIHDGRTNTTIISGQIDDKHVTFRTESGIGETFIGTLYPTNLQKDEKKAETERLYKKGLKQQEIASRLNISQSSVSKYLNEK